MSFTFDTSTNIGKIRTLIGDVTEASALLSDEEINVFLSITSNDLFESAALACRRIVATKALLAKIRAAGDYKEDLTKIAKYYQDLAKDYHEMSINTPADAQAEIAYTDFNYNSILQSKALRDEFPDE